jgi:hypothetical protein
VLGSLQQFEGHRQAGGLGAWPLVTRVRRRTEAKVDSIGLLELEYQAQHRRGGPGPEGCVDGEGMAARGLAWPMLVPEVSLAGL